MDYKSEIIKQLKSMSGRYTEYQILQARAANSARKKRRINHINYFPCVVYSFMEESKRRQNFFIKFSFG